jgi:uncharacterized membrane protein YfcA
MRNRRGEKLGWTLGGLGGSLWMIPVSILSFWSGRFVFGLVGLGLFALAVTSVVYLAPWRHPRVRCWRLLLPCCAVVALAGILLLGVEGSPYVRRLLWGQVPLMMVFASPLSPVGRLRWQDREPSVAAIPLALATPGADGLVIPSNDC